MNYKFNISLSVLNHLGRNLYRNFVTVIGEAISNSWDADATNVWIEIDRDSRTMFIIDDGKGMTSEDFQEKFLKIGYTKRKDGQNHTSKGRRFIGRKGIGKLALLSCARKVHVVSKTINSTAVGGLIDNSGLDKAITDDVSTNDYVLEKFSPITERKLFNLSSGTAIYFENLNDGLINTIDYLRKIIALNFRFSLIDQSFNIFLNGNAVTIDDLDDLAKATQFVWQLNDIDDDYLKLKISPSVNSNVKEYSSRTSQKEVYGFIASTNFPSDLKIRGANEKVSIDLFVNGRLREKDILKHIPTTRVVESYLYGQIHYDVLDYELDAFTSSREGVVNDDPLFLELIKEFEPIIRGIIDEWDVLRRRIKQHGDPGNTAITMKRRRAQELFDETAKDIVPPRIIPPKGLVECWIEEFGKEAQFNIPSYTECFIVENLLRKLIQHNRIELNEQTLKEIKKQRDNETNAKNVANIVYEIRQNNNDLQYLDMSYLSNFVDKSNDPNKLPGISRDSKIFKPIRDAVAHTSLITDVAKSQLNVTFANIQARVIQLLDEDNNENETESKKFEVKL